MSSLVFAESSISNSGDARLLIGSLRTASGDEFVVFVQDGLHPARRAEGCLADPQPGDSVLLIVSDDGDVFIINVIQRASRGPLRLSHPVGLTLAAPALAIQADETLSASAPKAVLHLADVTLRSASASLIARAASVVAEGLRTVAATIEQAAETLLAQAAQRTAVISGVDTLEACAANTKVETALVVRTGSTILTAEQDVRMDAERITLA
jgi:hypothetical protein